MGGIREGVTILEIILETGNQKGRCVANKESIKMYRK